MTKADVDFGTTGKYITHVYIARVALDTQLVFQSRHIVVAGMISCGAEQIVRKLSSSFHSIFIHLHAYRIITKLSHAFFAPSVAEWHISSYTLS